MEEEKSIMWEMPLQPLYVDTNNVIRFRGNKIVKHLLDTHPCCDLNKLATLPFTKADQEQFAMLIGYSVTGFGELSYVSDKTYEKVQIKVIELEIRKLQNKIDQLKTEILTLESKVSAKE